MLTSPAIRRATMRCGRKFKRNLLYTVSLRGASYNRATVQSDTRDKGLIGHLLAVAALLSSTHIYARFRTHEAIVHQRTIGNPPPSLRCATRFRFFALLSKRFPGTQVVSPVLPRPAFLRKGPGSPTGVFVCLCVLVLRVFSCMKRSASGARPGHWLALEDSIERKRAL